MLLELLNIFLEQTPPLINMIKESVEKKDWDILYAATHKVSTSLRMVGLSDEYLKMIKNIMDHSYNKEYLNDIPEMVLTIVEVSNQVFKELDEEYKTLLRNKRKNLK